MKTNIILIGMPSCGKSTIGRRLAAMLGYHFIDTDDIIIQQNGRPLRDIIRLEGLDGFRFREEQAICSVNTESTVIATGGSAVYSNKAMSHLQNMGTVVYLAIPFETLTRRIGDPVKRGVKMPPTMTLRELYDERTPLYESYASLTVEEAMDDTVESTAIRLMQLLK